MSKRTFGIGLWAALLVGLAGGCKRAPSTDTASGGQTNQPSALNPQPSTPGSQLATARVHWLGMKRVAADTTAAYVMGLWTMPETDRLRRQTLDKLALALIGDTALESNYEAVVSSIPPATNTPSAQAGTNGAAPLGGPPAAQTASQPPIPKELAAQLAALNSQLSTNLFRPLLDDLVQEESYLEVWQATNQPAELALAIRLDALRAALWSKNLGKANPPAPGSGAASQAESAPSGVAPAGSRPAAAEAMAGGKPSDSAFCILPSAFSLSRCGDWTIVTTGKTNSALVLEFCQRIQRDHTPVSGLEGASWFESDAATRRVFPVQAPTPWLAADLDLARLAAAVGLTNLSLLPPSAASGVATAPPSAGLPRLSLSVAGEGQNVRTRADLDFPQPLALQLEPWNIPTNLIHDPLIGFMAIRGIRPWLQAFKPWNDLQLGTAPNQAYFWAQGGSPDMHYMALPSVDASNQASNLIQFALHDVNAILATNKPRLGTFLWDTNSQRLAWRGIPWFAPTLNCADSAGNPCIFAGFSPERLTNQPPPAPLLEQVVGPTNLLWYDWEITQPCLNGLGQLFQMSRHVFGRARMTHTAGLDWAIAVAPRLGNSITGIKLSGPARLTLTRNSSMGFTAAELELLIDWLESPAFPRGLHTFLAVPEPRPGPQPRPAPPVSGGQGQPK